MRSSASSSRGNGELRNHGRIALGVSPRRDNALPAKFTKGRLLGKGGFAEVFETRDTDSNELLALKIVDKAQVTSARAQSKLRSEIEIHRSLSHDRVVRFLEHYEDRDNVYILLELCPNRSLSELVRKRPGRRLSEAEAMFYLRDLVIGLQYLHDTRRRVIHRDLKLGNLFIDAAGRLKVGDFGLAAKLETDAERRRTRCGTPNYIAPEILEDVGHSYAVDVWSLGVIAYTMLCGRPPFEAPDVKAVYKRIQRNEWSWPSSVNLTDSSKDLVTRILRTDPRARPGLDEILAMPFFSEPVVAHCTARQHRGNAHVC